MDCYLSRITDIYYNRSLAMAALIIVGTKVLAILQELISMNGKINQSTLRSSLAGMTFVSFLLLHNGRLNSNVAATMARRTNNTATSEITTPKDKMHKNCTAKISNTLLAKNHLHPYTYLSSKSHCS